MNKRGSGIKPLLASLLVVGLFIFAFINAGIMIASNNNANQSIGDDPTLSAYKSNLETTLKQAETDTNSSIEAIGQSPLSSTSNGFIFDAISGIWKTLKSVPVTLYNLTFGLTKAKLFGEAFTPVFSIIAAILIMAIIFGVIKMISSGQDE